MITSNKLNSDSPIAFFDSGIGGLTVLNKVKKVLPDESFIYYGDTVHMPYGEKTKEQLLEYSDNIFQEKPLHHGAETIKNRRALCPSVFCPTGLSGMLGVRRLCMEYIVRIFSWL